MGCWNKKHILCLIIFIVISLYSPLSYINLKAYSSFKINLPKEELLMIPSGIQQLPSGYNSKKPFFLLKPMLRHMDLILNTIFILACYICLLFIRAIINKRRLIHELCVVKLHGSKYKSPVLSF